MGAKKIFKGAGIVALIISGWFAFDRLAVKKLPLFPLSLKKAQEKKASNVLEFAEKKLKKLMNEGKINGFGTRHDDETKQHYIEIASSKITSELKNELPSKLDGVELRLVQREMAKAL